MLSRNSACQFLFYSGQVHFWSPCAQWDSSDLSLWGFRPCSQVLIFLKVPMSSTGRREAGPLLCRHQFRTPSCASRAMYCHDCNTGNTEVAVGSRCRNTYGHERLQQHMSLGKLNHFLLSALSLLFDFVETAILQDMFLCCTHICQEAEFSFFSKKALFLTRHKAAGQQSCLSQQDVKLGFAKQTLS